jgi:dolichyl-phosphate beta-glucosyltransferase
MVYCQKSVMDKLVTFIVPCFNESIRLKLAEDAFTHFFLHTEIPCKVIFINDGSTDDTEDRLRELAYHLNKVAEENIADVIGYTKNSGKGYALKKGIQAATTNWVLTIDADMAAKPDELLIWNRKNYLDLNVDHKIYIGSREKGIESHLVESKFMRRSLGLAFNFVTKKLTGLKFRDTQCGFKLYPTNVAKEAFEELYDYGFAHDVEVLLKLKKNDITINTLPLRWTQIPGSKVNVVKDSMRMLRTVLKVRKKYRL